MILVDTGPLVALFDPADGWHARCAKTLQHIATPLYTSMPVLTEAFHLLSPDSIGSDRLMEFIQAGGMSTWNFNEQHLARAFNLMDTYRSVAMDFADACVVSLSEGDPKSRVWTTDSDFLVYRRHGRQAIPLIAPFFEEQGFGILACSPSGNLHLRQPLCRIAEAIQPHVELVHER